MSEMNLDTDIAPGWRPAEGDTIIGEVLEVSSGWSDYADDYYPIVTIKPDSPVKISDPKAGKDSDKTVETTDPVAVHCFHQVLRDRMVENRPELGERVGIKFKGQVKSKDNKRTISVYVVRVDREATAAWDNFGQSARQRQSQSKRAAEQQQPLPESDIPNDDNTDDDIPF